MPFESLSKQIPQSKSVQSFFGELIACRQSVKLTHWAQPDKTDATHAALDEIYDDLDGLIDSLIEKYQGVHGLVKIIIPQVTSVTDPLRYVTIAYETIESDRKCIKESFLQNIIDEIQAVLAKGLYKLKFVKSHA